MEAEKYQDDPAVAADDSLARAAEAAQILCCIWAFVENTLNRIERRAKSMRRAEPAESLPAPSRLA
jgi:hypothetical protein